jgi:hypothetical protein
VAWFGLLFFLFFPWLKTKAAAVFSSTVARRQPSWKECIPHVLFEEKTPESTTEAGSVPVPRCVVVL